MINPLPTPQDRCQFQLWTIVCRSRDHKDIAAHLIGLLISVPIASIFKRGNSVKEQWHWLLSQNNLWTIVRFVKLSCTCIVTLIIVTIYCLLLISAIAIKRLVFLMCSCSCSCAIIANLHQNSNILAICATPHLTTILLQNISTGLKCCNLKHECCVEFHLSTTVIFLDFFSCVYLISMKTMI